MTSFLESLPTEILQKIALYLDPKSLVSFMDSSPEMIRKKMEESGSSFWGRFAKINKVRPYSSILENDDDDDDNSSKKKKKTIADRIVTLDERKRSGTGQIGRCDMMKGDRIPYAIEDESGQEVAVLASQEEAGQESVGRLISDLQWSGKYACFAFFENEVPRLLIWNTRSDPPALVDTPPSEFLPSPDTLAVWRHYVMFTPWDRTRPTLTKGKEVREDGLRVLFTPKDDYSVERRKVKKGEELNLLTIFDLEKKGWEGGKSVLIKAEEDFEPPPNERNVEMAFSIRFVIVLETAGGEAARAVVRHLLMPGTIFIVKVPEAVVERKILFPTGGEVSLCTFDTRSYSSPCSCATYGCVEADIPIFLTFACPDATTTIARFLALDKQPEYMHVRVMAITSDGDILTVRAMAADGAGSQRKRLEYNLVLYADSTTTTTGDDCMVLEHESHWEELAVLKLSEYGYQIHFHQFYNRDNESAWMVKVNPELKIAAVMFRADLEGENGESWIQVVDYGGQQLRPMYRILLSTSGEKPRRPLEMSMVGDRYLSLLEMEMEKMEEEGIRKDFVVTTYDERSGEKAGEKKLGVACQSTESGILMYKRRCFLDGDDAAVLMSVAEKNFRIAAWSVGSVVEEDCRRSFCLVRYL